jgi:cadmium resistance protein CadD (predicted permease)
MSWFAGAIIAGITSFAATNIDDIVILMLFFAQVNSTFRRRHIVIGQYLGFTVLIFTSLPGFFGGLIAAESLDWNTWSSSHCYRCQPSSESGQG